MGRTLGRVGMLSVSTDGIVAYVDVGAITALDYSEADEAVDDTSFDSDGHKESVAGESQSSLSATWNRDEADAGQDVVRTAKQAKAKMWFRYRPTVAASADQMTFCGQINSLKNSNGRNALVEQSLEVSSSGAITHDTQ